MDVEKHDLSSPHADESTNLGDISGTDSFGGSSHGAKDVAPRRDGIHAWMTVLGSWLLLFATMGNIYSFGVYQDFYTRIFLTSFSPSSIGWMGSVQMMLPLAVSLMSGRCLDAGYFHHVVLLGSIIFSFSQFMLSLAHKGKYYQVFLSQGLGIGIGAGLIFSPASSIVTLHFQNRPHRHLAYGIALSGISFGAVVFPIGELAFILLKVPLRRGSRDNAADVFFDRHYSVLNHMMPLIGFSEATRNAAYITAACLIPGNLLVRVPHGMKLRAAAPGSFRNMGTFFRDPPYCLLILGSTLATIAVYFPAIYLQLYAVEQNIGTRLAFFSVAIVNGSGIVGRLLANHLADVYGLWNLHVASTLLTGAAIWTVLSVTNKAALVVVAIFYGMCSGAWFSLTMAANASLSPNSHEIGARTGVALAIVSIGLLLSIPMQGALLTPNFHWIRPIAFSGSMMFVAAVLSLCVRIIIARRKNSQFV